MTRRVGLLHIYRGEWTCGRRATVNQCARMPRIVLLIILALGLVVAGELGRVALAAASAAALYAAFRLGCRVGGARREAAIVALMAPIVSPDSCVS
jgi:hypothetical protein